MVWYGWCVILQKPTIQFSFYSYNCQLQSFIVLLKMLFFGCCECCSVLQNSIEIHIHHIQNGLTQIGNLHAFAISQDTT